MTKVPSLSYEKIVRAAVAATDMFAISAAR